MPALLLRQVCARLLPAPPVRRLPVDKVNADGDQQLAITGAGAQLAGLRQFVKDRVVVSSRAKERRWWRPRRRPLDAGTWPTLTLPGRMTRGRRRSTTSRRRIRLDSRGAAVLRAGKAVAAVKARGAVLAGAFPLQFLHANRSPSSSAGYSWATPMPKAGRITPRK